ncbi:MAG: TonB-dependent receptor [Bacteroidales bacterium]|nr:TonB-dependent receptor [Bacteroidales bacterium]
MLQYANAQTVSGVITDSGDGQPIPGVNILVKGTSNGTISDLEGKYSVEVLGENPVLVFSFIGYKNVEVEVAGQTVINVQLEVESTGLDEVVVTGYGFKKKKLITGANLNVKGEDITELNTGSAMEALQGVAPGVSITRNSGQPGAGTKVVIRGIGTNGNSNPLYIVDGVAVGNIDYLNPADIQAIDVLKDAASCAIYGSRAANGVILVTTKKGETNAKPTITYDAYYGVQNIYKKLPALNAQEYMYIMDEGRVNDGLAPNDWHAMLIDNPYLNANYPDNLGTQLGEYVWDKLQNGWTGTDWVSEIDKKDAPVQNHSLNITGGGEDFAYSAGFSYFDQTGIIGGDIMNAGYKRFTARLNTEFILIKTSSRNLITIGENFTFQNSENRATGTGNIYWNDLHDALVVNPLLPAYWGQTPNQDGFTPTLEGIARGQHDPMATMFYRHNYQYGKGNSIVGNVYANIEPIKNLKFRSSFGINSWFGHSRSWTPTYKLATLYNNTTDATQQDMYAGIDMTWTNTLSYQFAIGEHDFNVLGGTEILQNILNNSVGGWRANTVFGNPDYAYLRNANPAQSTADINTWGQDWAANGGGLVSYFGRISYSFMDKYLVDATMRADGSANFAKGNRWGYFPSFSAGWVLSREDFMQGFEWVNFAKLRASWGQNGNQSVNNFIYSSNISYLPQGYYYGTDKLVSSPTAVPSNVPNPDITWETSEQLNFGLDANFLNSRLALNFDWYKKTTKNWLVTAPVLGTAGAGAPTINGGDIENKGYEIVLSWNDMIGDIKYGVTLSGAHNVNEVTRLANTEGIINGFPHILSQGTAYLSRVQVGYPIGYFYGFKTDGLLQNQDDVDAYVGPDGTPYFENQRPGDVKFVDQNNDGVIDDDDKVMLGSPLPDFELGVQLNFEYKGFYLNSTLAGKFGMQVMQSYRSFADNFTQNYTTQIFGRWHGEGTSNKIPRLSAGSNQNTNFISDIYMHNADFLRVTNLTFGYKFDKFLSNVNWMRAASLYVSFNNLYTFTKYDGMDPDVRFGGNDEDMPWASGVDLGLYPLPRTVIFGLNVTF